MKSALTILLTLGIIGCGEEDSTTSGLGVASATKLAFINTALNQTTTHCGLLQVQAQDEQNGAITMTEALSVTFTASAGTLYSDASCTTALTNNVSEIPMNTSRVEVYFKNTSAAVATITADETEDTGLTAASQDQTTTAPILSIYAPTLSDVSETTCTQIGISIVDSAGTQILTGEELTISLSSTSGAYYSDSNCTTAVQTATIPNATGSISAPVYYKTKTNGESTLTFADSGTHSITAVTSTATATIYLLGTWKTSCFTADTEQNISTYVFNADGTFTHTLVQYAEDDRCETAELTLATGGTYEIGIRESGVEGTQLDLTFSTFTATANASGLASYFSQNSSSFWGVSSWVVGTANDVLGASGPFNRSSGDKVEALYNYYQDDSATSLSFGNSFYTNSGNTRPTSVGQALSTLYTKQ